VKLTLVQKKHLADNVWRFEFAPDRPLAWIAGQFIRLELPHSAPDGAGTTRWFTISGAPHEGQLTVTTRMSRSSFKQALSRLEPGQAAQMIEEPAGDFIWRDTTSGHVFAAQGIGITPFYAIIKDRVYRGLPLKSTLIYGHQPGSSLVYGSELENMAQLDPTLKIIPFEGTLTPAHVTAHFPDLGGRYVYVSGPKSFLSLCLPPHNLPISRLKQENFPGYGAGGY
jgi:ferredoxin-NADP reductase